MNIAAKIKATLTSVIASVAAQNSTSNAFVRNTKLSLVTIISFMLGAEGGSLKKELHKAGIDATPAAISQRRGQIRPKVFYNVFADFNAACVDAETYRGYHLLAVDGTSVNIPRNPNSPSFVCHSSAPCGYNQLHVNPLYDLCNKTYFDAVIQPEPHKDEIGALVEMLERNSFPVPTIIVADRGYEAYNVIAHLIEKENLEFIIRVKQNHSAMREIARLPMFALDCDISFTITTTQTNEDKKNRHIYLQVPKKSKEGAKTRRGRWDFPSPYKMNLRIVRFQLENGTFETIATSLPRTFTPADIRELYHLRWGIETSFRDLKYTLGLVNLHGKSDEFVQQEIWAALTMFNFASRISREVIVRQPKGSAYVYRLNFKMAVYLCREFFKTKGADGEKLLADIAKNVESVKPGRADQRNLRAKGFVGFTYRVAA